MNPILFYCYDAYCGWCFGFSPIMKKLAEDFPNLQIEVLSGGMVLPASPVHISNTAGYIQKAYKTVEEYAGVKFGNDYLWHINNPDLSDWYPNSEKPAIALSIFKEIYPENQVAFAADLQEALHIEGRDLTDDESYKHLLEKYSIQPALFYERLKSEEFKEKAYYEFSLVKQLQITGFPSLLLQTSETKFHLLARGFTPYADLKPRLTGLLATLA
jgi:putative protein-disulfide isomerase